MATTLLVLGAGASQPYGYPTGGELLRHLTHLQWLGGVQPPALGGQVLHQLDIDAVGRSFRRIQEAGLSFVEFAEMGRELVNSGLQSIDSFISRRPEFSHHGQFAVASHLIERENAASLMSPSVAGGWYRLFWQSLLGSAHSLENIDFEKFCVATFNYDRSLEAFLITAMSRTFSTSPQECSTHLQRMRICHLYGDLGVPSLTESHGPRYGEVTSTAQIVELAKRIAFTPQARSAGGGAFETARNWALDASSIAFLGYGFDQFNDERLGLRAELEDFVTRFPQKPRRRVYASMLGQGELQIETKLSRCVGPDPTICLHRHHSGDCVSTISKFALFGA